ncbi:MAG: PqqD family protein [Prevotella sp.]|nr:PqqD family protein [Prevotella sp.]
MKVKKGFNLREVCGEHIIVAEGDENIDFSNIISMNESSAYLWEEAQKKNSFNITDLAKLLCSQYEVDMATALKDATTLAAQWGAAGIIEGDDVPEGTIRKTVAQESNTATRTEKPKEKKGFFKKIFG